MSEITTEYTKKYTVKNVLINCYLVLLFALFPLYVTSQYENIRHDKFYIFIALSAVLVIAEIPMIVYSAFTDNKSWYKKLSVTDYSFVVLIIVFTVSLFCSDNVSDGFIGESGRFCGYLTFIIFFLVYLIITRNYIYKEYVFVVFAAAVIFVFLLGILNSFGIDPLGMYEGYSDEVRKDYVSTIGNKNFMSAFCCVTVPAFFVLFLHNKSSLRLLYLLTAVIGLFAMIRCDSMSGYLGFVPVFAVLSLFYTRNKYRKLFWILVAVYSAVVVTFLALFIYFTFIDTVTPLGGFMRFFRFDDKWGTHRGYMWNKSFEIFKRYNIKNILFGCGPDGYYRVFEPYFGELYTRFGDSVNNAAHNELLNYLITTGVLGLAAYLTLVISALVRAFKAASKNTLALAFAAPVLCYLFQSIVNVSTIIVLPFLFIFIALAENISKNELNAS